MRRLALASTVVVLIRGALLLAQNATVEIADTTLNAALGRMGVLSDTGAYSPRTPGGWSGAFRDCSPVGFLQCPGVSGGLVADAAFAHHLVEHRKEIMQVRRARPRRHERLDRAIAACK